MIHYQKGYNTMQQSQYKSNFELKFLARAQTGRHFGLLLGTIILKFAITLLVANIASVLAPVDTTVGLVINFILVFLVDAAASILSVGASLVFLKTACNMKSSIEDLFCGFQKNTFEILKIGAIIALIESICSIPLDIASLQYANIVNTVPLFKESNDAAMGAFLMGGSISSDELLEAYGILSNVSMKLCLIMVVCTVTSLVLTLPFFPALFMVLDFPDWNASTILKMSFEVMHGNKLRLFLLYISFIPAYLLGIFTCGLSLIWVIPYMNMTLANFYLDLMAARNRKISEKGR